MIVPGAEVIRDKFPLSAPNVFHFFYAVVRNIPFQIGPSCESCVSIISRYIDGIIADADSRHVLDCITAAFAVVRYSVKMDSVKGHKV